MPWLVREYTTCYPLVLLVVVLVFLSFINWKVVLVKRPSSFGH